MQISIDDLEQLVISAAAHAVTRTTQARTYDRLYQQLQLLLAKLPAEDAELLCMGVNSELKYLAREGLANPDRAEAFRGIVLRALDKAS